ncbi:MAG: PAS domain S-box protein [Sedimentisphaerales bacterium]
MWTGGGGMFTGICVIISSALIGLLFNYLRKSKPQLTNTVNLYIFGFIVHINMLFWMLTLPQEVVIKAYKTITLPVLLILPLGSLCFGKLLSNQEEQVKIANELIEKEELLRKMGEIAKIGAWEFDVKTRQNKWTNEVFRIHDLNPDQENNIEIGLSLYSKESREKIETTMKKAIEFNKVYELELEITTAKGINKWVRISGAPVFENNKIIKVRGSFQDITERKKAKEVLRESEQKFRSLFDIANDGMLVADAESRRFYMANRKICQMLGYTVEEIKSLAVTDIHPRESLPYVTDQFEKQRLKEIEIAPNMPVKRKDGSIFYADISSIPIMLEGKPYLLGNFRDVTERGRAEASLKSAYEELEATVEKLTCANRELHDLTYITAHDLKTPISGIEKLAEWILTEYGDKFDKNVREQMNMLLARTERMYNIIDSLLQYSRIGRIKRKPAHVNLNQLVSEAIDTIAPPKNIVITIENELPVIECEETDISQVFKNLINNAVKYIDKPQGRVKISCVSEDDFWKFSIADNGPGIEEKYFEKIFQIFQTLQPKDKFEGTGAGLTIAKKIIELYGGQIWVESEPSRGSTFFFTLPKQNIGAENAKLQTSIAY